MEDYKLTHPGVVIVSYNSAELAYVAALSALGARPLATKTRVVLVDNYSTEESFNVLIALAKGQTRTQGHPASTDIIFANPDSFSVALCVIEAGQRRVVFGDLDSADLVIIRSDRNGGFSAGCNIGLRFLEKTPTDMFLLLNPDTQLDQGALRAFAAKLEGDRTYGLVGASLLEMDQPHGAQALGGAAIVPWSLLGENLGVGCTRTSFPRTAEIEQCLAYPVGAAMAFRCDWLAHVGLMDERYFLFYEEFDWVMAGRDKYRPGWVKGALVYHHRGAVVGSHLGASHRSALADYHMIRSRILFAKKWRPWLLPVLWSLGGVQALRRRLRGQKPQARAVMKATLPGAPALFKP